jgi:polyisoprenoid-binding protein YceI
MKKLLFIGLLCIPVCLWAQHLKPVYPIKFQISNAGITVNGTLADWELNVDFDNKHPEKSSIRGLASPASITTGIPLRDSHLQGRQYFFSGMYPYILITSKSISANGKNSYSGVFELEIRKIKKEVIIPFTVSSVGKRQQFKGEFTINRLDFELGEKSLVLGDRVKVFIEFML